MDKKALLDELRIDRDAGSTATSRPIKWFLAIALLGGVGFVTLFVEFPTEASSMPVRTVLARVAAAVPAGESVLDATGYVVARRQATVSSKATGKVVEIFIEEGMAVESGQLLAQLDDSIPRAQLELAQSQYRASRAALEEFRILLKQEQLDLERTQGLAQRSLASQADLDRDGLTVDGLIARLARARQELNVAERRMAVQQQIVSDMQIRAPFAGVVVAKAAQPGEMISPVSAGGGFTRTGICTIVDMSSLEVEVDVNEAYINRVYAKQPVTVTLNAYPDLRMPAEVIAIIPTADRNKATVRVRVGFLERDDRVLPDMGVKVAFLDDTAQTEPVAAPAGVLVPSKAIADAGAQPFVWVVNEDRVSRRTVVVGDAQGSRVRVISGLADGERIVASVSDEGAAGLTDGVRVNVSD